MSEPRLTVVIGANGAGKTTWARKHRETLPKPFYNADSIAEGLGDANDAALQRAARKLVDDRIQRDLSEGNTFGFESTYSGRSRPDIVRTAKRLGYTTRAVYLGTETVAINIRRVRKRVEEGGAPCRRGRSETTLDSGAGEPPRYMGGLRHGPDPRQLRDRTHRDRTQDQARNHEGHATPAVGTSVAGNCAERPSPERRTIDRARGLELIRFSGRFMAWVSCSVPVGPFEVDR